MEALLKPGIMGIEEDQGSTHQTWENQVPLGLGTERRPLPECTSSSRVFHTDAPSPCPMLLSTPLKLRVTTAILQIEKQLRQATPGSEVSSTPGSLGLVPRPAPHLPCRHAFVYACSLNPSQVPTAGQAQIADMHTTAYLMVP